MCRLKISSETANVRLKDFIQIIFRRSLMSTNHLQYNFELLEMFRYYWVCSSPISNRHCYTTHNDDFVPSEHTSPQGFWRLILTDEKKSNTGIQWLKNMCLLATGNLCVCITYSMAHYKAITTMNIDYMVCYLHDCKLFRQKNKCTRGQSNYSSGLKNTDQHKHTDVHRSHMKERQPTCDLKF